MVAQDRARTFFTPAILPLLCVPAVALTDEPVPSASEADAAMHGTFNNGEDFTLPRNLIQLRERYERLPDAHGREPEKW